jgi:ABC-type nitrate/sulfonate/bicarbonate transport system permease component
MVGRDDGGIGFMSCHAKEQARNAEVIIKLIITSLLTYFDLH